MQKIMLCLFIFLILCLSVLPPLGMLMLGESGPAANERLSPKPEWKTADGGINTNYFSEASDYFEDHFAFRREMITANSMLRANLFGESAQSQVTVGQEDWLFYEETLDDYAGADLLSPRQVWCAAHSLRLMQDAVEKTGGRFAFTIAPDKISLYPQYGPSGLEPGETTSAELLKTALEREGVHYTDLFSAFRNQQEILYHKWDSHWTMKGAALARDALLETLEIKEPSAFERSGHFIANHEGDLYAMLYPSSAALDEQWEFDEPLAFDYVGSVRSPEDLRIQATSGSPNGNLLMYRDSFGNTLHSLMAECFSNATFTRATPYRLSMMEETEADYVVLELVERNLYRLAEEAIVMPAPEVEPPAAEEVQAAIAMNAEPSQTLSDYIQISGTIYDRCDEDSPILLQAMDGKTYEAFPTGAGDGIPFAIYLPKDTNLNHFKIMWKKEGKWVAAASYSE